jgi:uncharacterized protein (DUF608 family)
MEWFEYGEWVGWTAHAGSIRLSGLLMLERMAKAMGDGECAARCRKWFTDGTRAMEAEMWTGEYYLNYLEPETGKKSDDVMAYQIDGEVIARYHGLEGIFRPDRVSKVLDTVRRCNIALNIDLGAVNFARPDGSPLEATSQVAVYGQYVVFPHEILLLAATYAFAGEKEYGLELLRKHWTNLVLKQGYAWDYPNILDREGKRFFGTDYYMDMILWMYPAVLEGRTLGDACTDGSLVRKVLEAGQGSRGGIGT